MTFTLWRSPALALSLALSLAGLLSGIGCAAAASPDLAGRPSFADLADLTFAAPVIARGTVKSAVSLDTEAAGPAAAGFQRQLVTAQLLTVLRAPEPIPPEISYLRDTPKDSRGKAVKTKGEPVLLFLRPAGERRDQFRLVGANAQLVWTAGIENDVRELLAADASGSTPTVTGVGAAFRVAGSVTGESESQFFLNTRSGKPVSLVLLTRPGQPRSLTVALGDVIDDAAQIVQPRTLLWYRLACFLPDKLPEAALRDADPALATDYAAALALLGPCDRTTASFRQ